jgi:predicted ester cyclase
MTEVKAIEDRVSDYEKIRDEAASLYRTFRAVEIPALGQRVQFTSEGFNHLVYNAPGKMRDKRAQILRFDMLERAKFVLETATTYQEYDEEMIYKKVNRRGTWVPMNVVIRSWGLVAIVRKFRIKVVITQEGNGAVRFLSVAPAWVTKQYRDIKLIKTSVGKGLRAEDDDENILKSATRG